VVERIEEIRAENFKIMNRIIDARRTFTKRHYSIKKDDTEIAKKNI
jgi:hypothetical protein